MTILVLFDEYGLILQVIRQVEFGNEVLKIGVCISEGKSVKIDQVFVAHRVINSWLLPIVHKLKTGDFEHNPHCALFKHLQWLHAPFDNLGCVNVFYCCLMRINWI